LFALLAAGCFRPDKRQMVPIGGGWYFHLQSHLPEAGWVPTDLYRDWKGGTVLVASNIQWHKFYEPDCVVFVTNHADPPYVYYAACGDRQPVGIDVRDDELFWKMEADGLRNVVDVRIEDGKPIQRSRWIPIEELRALSSQQPPFEPGWRPGRRSAVRAMAPLEIEDLVDAHTENAAHVPLVDAVAGTGRTPAERLALVDALIRHGGNVNIADPHGFSVLMLASSRGEPVLVRRLLRAGARVDLQAADGRTALMLAAESRGARTETVTLLVEAGASRTLRDRSGRTAADRLPADGDDEVRALLGPSR